MPIKEEQFTPAIWFELKFTPTQAPLGYYTEVSGLTAEIETMSYNEGGRNDSVHKLPTRMKHPNLVLKRGVTTVKDLQEWLEDSWNGPTRKELTLTMYNEHLEKIRVWSFKNAYPVKWTGPTFNAAQNTVATESIEIVHDGIQVGV
jgi:phage tail-like protein